MTQRVCKDRSQFGMNLSLVILCLNDLELLTELPSFLSLLYELRR